MLPQEDFDTHTSVDTDVVKKTDAQLNPMPEEGGELPGKIHSNRFKEQTNAT